MNKEVLSNYEVNRNRLALLPVANQNYQTIVLERNCEFYIRKTPMQLIKKACLEGGATYEGRQKAVVYLTGAKHKVPIPVDPLEQIYAFPSHSPTQFECSWIFYNNVQSITPHLLPNQPTQTLVTFQKEKKVILPVSYYIIEKQMQRTSHCIIRFSRCFNKKTNFTHQFYSTEISL